MFMTIVMMMIDDHGDDANDYHDWLWLMVMIIDD